MRSPKRAACSCEYCDPLLWTQAQSAAVDAASGRVGKARAANAVGLLAELVRGASHPELREEQ